ncbi:MAG TPA: ParB/RepB/Spo0J family partition protein [Pirellulales bacterium]|jgi:ParB/RepB/Spo0J family partition protein
MARKLVERRLDEIVSDMGLRGEVNDESLIPMARSIQECGLQNPATVHPDGHVITGHRRLKAMRLLKAQSMLVIEDDGELSEATVIQREVVENRMREGLPPSREAAGIRRYLELTGLSQKEAAGKFGMSGTALIHTIAIAALPPAMQEAIDSGAIPKSAAYSLARIPDPGEQEAQAKRIMEGTLTRDGLIGALKNRGGGSPNRPGRKLARGVAVLGDGRSVTVSGADLTLETFIETIEAVLGKARRVRARGIELRRFLKTLRTESRAAVATS